MRRPLLWILAFYILIILIYRAVFYEEYSVRYFVLSGYDENVSKTATGTVYQTARRDREEEHWLILLKNVTVHLPQEETKKLRFLPVYWEGTQVPSPGNRVEVTGTITPVSRASNPGQFDFAAYYAQKDIYYSMFVTGLKVQSQHTYPVKAGLYRLRSAMCHVYEQVLPHEDAGILSAMILGDRSNLDLEQKEEYQKNGIGHILAISGLHVGLLGMFCFGLCRRIRLPLPWCAAVSMMFVFCYGYMTDFSFSTSRAVIMLFLVYLAMIVGKSYDLPAALALSCLLILMIHPLAMYQSGFLLSYSAVGAVYLLAPLAGKLRYETQEDARDARRRRQIRHRERLADSRLPLFWTGVWKLRQTLCQTLWSSVVIWVGTLPVVLSCYYEIPLYSSLLNLLVLPLSSILVILGFLTGLIGILWLPAAMLPGRCIHGILWLYHAGCRCMEHLPGNVWITGKPDPRILLLWTLLSALGYAVIQVAKCLSVRRMGLLFWLCGLILLLCPLRSLSQSAFTFAMLDVGQGDGLFFRSPQHKIFLMDSGSSSEKQVGKNRTMAYLLYHGIASVDYLFVSHPDEDHINGVQELLQDSGRYGFTVRSLVMPACGSEQEAYQDLLRLAVEHGVDVQFWQAGDSYQEDTFSIRCITPTAGESYTSSNEASMVLHLQTESMHLLLTGDVEGEGEETVTDYLKALPSDDKLRVLKVAHHGSKNSSASEFLQVYRPDVALISCGKKNRYGHPHRQTLNSLEGIGSRIYRTDQSGAIWLQEDHRRVRLYRFYEDSSSKCRNVSKKDGGCKEILVV